MQYKIKQWFAVLLALMMTFTTLPAALAESVTPTEGTKVEQVQAMIDELPEVEEITADNRADVEAQLTAIDEAKLALTDDERALLDTARYDAAVSSLSALDGQPSAGVPFGDGMLAFDSEEEALAYLWSLEDDEYGIMPIGEVTGKVAPDYFSFSIYGANESGTPTEYSGFDKLIEEYPDIGLWDGPDGGDLLKDGIGVEDTLNTYPQIPDYKISSIRLNGTIIYHLGMYEVNGHSYVHFTSIDVQGRLTTVVLTKDASDYTHHPFEVRYVPNEYEITYEVYLDSDKKDEGDEIFGLDKIFGANRATETADDWASVDVTIPAGYIGRVYIDNTAGFEPSVGNEKFPKEASYNNALGAEPKYTYNEDTNTIEIDTSGGAPDSYTLTGTYLVGSTGAGVSADQTVRVVLEKKESITFHAEAWQHYEIGGTDTENKVNEPTSTDGTRTNDGWTVEKEFTGDSVDFTWTVTMKDEYEDGSGNPVDDAELRTLEINGATIPVPFVSETIQNDSTTTTLPSGAKVSIAAEYNGGNPQYTITVTGATRDIWITGGSMNTGLDNTYKELIISGLYGVTVEVWAKNGAINEGVWTQVQAGDTFCTGYDWGADPHYENDANFNDAGFKYGLTGDSEDGDSFSGNVRFKLQEGFTFAGGERDGTETNPTVRLIDKYDAPKNSSASGSDGVQDLTVSEPDSEGWYYVTLVSPYGNTQVEAIADTTTDAYLLEVHAYPEQYIIVYQDGVSNSTGETLNPGIEGEVAGMPNYSDSNELDPTRYSHVDNNGHQYYALAAGDGSYTGGDASDSITVSNASPTITQDDPDARAVGFQGWVLTNADGEPYAWNDTNGDGSITIADKVKTPAETTSDSSEYPVIQPSDLLELRNIMDASTTGFGDTDTEYAIYLTALWSEPAPRYTYYVTFNYTDETGKTHEHVDATVTRDPTTYNAAPFDDGTDGYYIVKRETFFNMDGLYEFLGVTGLSVAFDPDNVSNISGGDIDWKWYKYDTTKNGSVTDGVRDPYKWTGVDNNGKVDVWFISTLGQLTIGKTVTDPFPTDTDPADAVRDSAVFTFDVSFTLPTDDPDTTMGNENEYFGAEGGSYSVQYTIDSGGPQEMELTKAEDGTYKGELKLKNGQTATFDLPAGTTYTVTERNYTPGTDGVGFELTEITNAGAPVSEPLSNGATGSITAATSATAVQFTNEPTTGGLTVTKTVTGRDGDTTKEWHFRVELSQNLTGTYGDMNFTDGVAEVTMRHGESKTATGLPSGITYTVTEEEADQYATSSTGATGTIPSGDTARAEFVNTRKTGGLTVSKTLGGSYGETDKDWTFTVTLSDTSISGAYGEMEFTNGVATFSLKGGESKTATGLPTGVTYTVTEEPDDNYTCSNPDGLTGSIAEGTATAAFTNTRKTGGLTVHKTVAGPGDTTKNWNFTVTLSDTTITGDFGGMTFTNGVATFTLKSGESETAIGLPSGITYTVTEAEANADGYLTTPSGANGTIPNGGKVEAHFINERPRPDVGNLTINKVVDGGGDEATNKTFTFTVAGPNGYRETVTITGNGSETLNNLPVGTYTVTEDSDGAAVKGYDLNVTGEGEVTITADATTSVTVTNTYTSTTGNLTVTKTVTGSGDTTKDWHFTVTLSDTTISGTYGDMTFTDGVAEFTLKHGQSVTALNLPEGIAYTVTESEANQDGYATTYTDDKGTIISEQDMVAAFINDKPAKAQDDPDNPPDNPDNPPDTPTDNPPDTPTSNNSDDTPKTGDASHLALWLSLMILSLIGITVTALTPIIGRKKLVSANGRHVRK